MNKWVFDQIEGEDVSIIKFDTHEDFKTFVLGLFNDYLVPKYGKEKAGQMPLGSWGPYEHNLGKVMAKAFGNPDYDTWVLVPQETLPDVQEYIDQLESRTIH